MSWIIQEMVEESVYIESVRKFLDILPKQENIYIPLSIFRDIRKSYGGDVIENTMTLIDTTLTKSTQHGLIKVILFVE